MKRSLDLEKTKQNIKITQNQKETGQEQTCQELRVIRKETTLRWDQHTCI